MTREVQLVFQLAMLMEWAMAGQVNMPMESKPSLKNIQDLATILGGQFRGKYCLMGIYQTADDAEQQRAGGVPDWYNPDWLLGANIIKFDTCI